MKKSSPLELQKCKQIFHMHVRLCQNMVNIQCARMQRDALRNLNQIAIVLSGYRNVRVTLVIREIAYISFLLDLVLLGHRTNQYRAMIFFACPPDKAHTKFCVPRDPLTNQHYPPFRCYLRPVSQRGPIKIEHEYFNTVLQTIR